MDATDVVGAPRMRPTGGVAVAKALVNVHTDRPLRSEPILAEALAVDTLRIVRTIEIGFA